MGIVKVNECVESLPSEIFAAMFAADEFIFRLFIFRFFFPFCRMNFGFLIAIASLNNCLGADILMLTMGGTKSHKIPFLELAKGLMPRYGNMHHGCMHSAFALCNRPQSLPSSTTKSTMC